MNHTYPVFLGTTEVGHANVMRQGLYYIISCECSLSGDVLYRACVSADGHMENLGILVPGNGTFFTRSRVAVNKFGNKELSFRVIPKHTSVEEKMIPIGPEEPFAYIARLDDAYLRKRNNKHGISFRELEVSSP